MTAVIEEHVQAGPPRSALMVDVYGAMEMLRLGRCTVLALADRGELPRCRTGRTVRFAISDVQALVDRMRSGEVLLPGGVHG
ncbi:MAG: helix-turn-helix domain-containing protein [Streptosporangiaceae bacterium]